MEELELLTEKGLEKIKSFQKNKLKYFLKSIIAGLLLGIGLIISFSLGALFKDDPLLSKVLISFTFGIGLVCIGFLHGELFKGNCLFLTIPILSKKSKLSSSIKTGIICYFGNVIGISLIAIIFILSQKESSLFEDYLRSACDNKLNFDVTSLIFKSILCNFIVCIASYLGFKLKSESAKCFLMMVLVGAFVIAGLEHCIANWGFFLMVFTQYGFSYDFTMFPLHMLITTIGNIIGGFALVALPYYFILKEEK